MKKTMLHSAIAAVIATFAVASSAAVITVDGTQKPITDTTIGGLVVQNGGSAVVDADGKRASEILCPWDNRSPPIGCIQ